MSLSHQERQTRLQKKYYAAGYHVFVLNYSVMEKASDFRPLKELASTVSYVRNHAEDWNLDADAVAVCGFSAGGHLAASLGTLYNEESFTKACPDLGNVSVAHICRRLCTGRK